MSCTGTSKEQDTCQEEKMGCKGCAFYKSDDEKMIDILQSFVDVDSIYIQQDRYRMKVLEAIKTQKAFIARKHHFLRVNIETLKESMTTLISAYDELWKFLEDKHNDVLDEFLKEE